MLISRLACYVHRVRGYAGFGASNIRVPTLPSVFQKRFAPIQNALKMAMGAHEIKSASGSQ